MEEFWSSFEAGTLEPYYTSEELPKGEIDPYLKKIVGLNFLDFVDGPSQVKVLYLFTDDEGCSTCK